MWSNNVSMWLVSNNAIPVPQDDGVCVTFSIFLKNFFRCAVQFFHFIIFILRCWHVHLHNQNCGTGLILASSIIIICVYIHFIHFEVCLTAVPKPLPKRALHIARSRASFFKWEYPPLSLRSSSRFLRLLPRLPLTSTPFYLSFNNLL